MSEYNENCKGYALGVKLSRIINSIGGKQREQGKLIFSPKNLDDTSQTNKSIFPQDSFLFLLYQQSYSNSLNTKFQVIKSQNRRKAKYIPKKIVLPFL